MESLAMLAAIIVLSVVASATVALGLSLAGLRIAGACVGVLGVGAAIWFGFIAPQAWLLWLPCLAASACAVARLAWR